MLPNPLSRPGVHPTSGTPIGVTTQKVVIVNGSPAVMALLETALDAGSYDIVFVESNAHAYSQVKRVRPDLVILCVRIEDPGGFQVLSMLKLDQETRPIPVLTYSTEYDGSDSDGEEPDSSETEILARSSAQRMN